ncbi:response regulator [Motiliproteus sediminis]|uniref:response regulator n=1 Tax=Motiliproteus sediminis TaxID=1468178 RepID=UPI001FEC3BDC|nr:response regulator [Motiliproteus sediminis]
MDDNRTRTLLLVDDEENILRSLKRLFRREGYTIITALSGAEGLELLAQYPVGVIVSDQRMPEMTGSEFLHKVKELYPDTVRIILSGYTDLESVTESINVGAVYKFLTKPWDDELLSKNVAEAFRLHELNDDNQRLTSQLRQANQELERRVEEKTRELQFNVQALKISQDVLEELPLAVLGISGDDVVVANRQARALFDQQPMMLGAPVAELLPESMLAIYRRAVDGQSACQEVTFVGKRWRCQCARNASEGPHQGYIFTLLEQ